MFWLFTQVWPWTLAALLLGVATGWACWARPLRRASDARSRRPAGSPPPS